MYPSFGDWLAAESYRDMVTGIRRGGRELPACVARTRQSAALDDPPTPDLAVSLVTRSAAGARREADCGHGRFTLGGKGAICVAPPSSHNRFDGPGPFEILVVSIPHDLAAALVERETNRPLDLAALHGREVREPACERLMRALWRAMTPGSTGSAAADLEVDGLAIALLARLLGHCSSDRRAPAARYPRRLSAAQLRRVDDLMRERLQCGVTVLQLAAVVGLCPLRFSRLFKQTVGEPPHRRFVRLRVEAAQDLMRARPDTALSDVALRCGFADQAHLTRHFRRLIGTTPGRFVAAVRPRR